MEFKQSIGLSVLLALVTVFLAGVALIGGLAILQEVSIVGGVLFFLVIGGSVAVLSVQVYGQLAHPRTLHRGEVRDELLSSAPSIRTSGKSAT